MFLQILRSAQNDESMDSCARAKKTLRCAQSDGDEAFIRRGGCYNFGVNERIAILGGTFDPIHYGHLAIAQDVCWHLDVRRMLFVPAAQQPFKLGVESVAADHRLAMARLAVEGNPHFEVSDLEVRRGGTSYSYDTVRAITEQHPDAELFFAAGADVLRDLHRWRAIDELLALCRFAIVRRPGYVLDLDAVYATLPAARGRLIEIVGPALDISATMLRERLQEEAPVRYQMPDAVIAYIEEHDLYRT
jgi:nicotinate-nucleotide adenylyltransferase